MASFLPCCALSLAVGQEPEPTPAVSPFLVPPPPVVVFAPPPILVPQVIPRITGLPVEGVAPAHRLAIVESGGVFIPSNDPRVGQVAQRLERLTAVYVEDAPRIADLTESACGALRAAKVPVSRIEMLDDALAARPASTSLGNFPRLYERFAASYQLSRLAPPKAP